MPLVKFVAPTDPRMLGTIEATRKLLVSDSLVYRYDRHAAPDGLTGTRGRSRCVRSGGWRRWPGPATCARPA